MQNCGSLHVIRQAGRANQILSVLENGAPEEKNLELLFEELQDWEAQLKHVDFDMEGPGL